MIVDSLRDLNLHDSELLEIVVDRVNTEADRVILYLDYIENYETVETSRKRLVFSGCYRLLLNMNFGVIAPESIKLGHEIEASDLIDGLRVRLAKVGVEINDKLRHFRIETNSTGSIIDIVAERLELLEVTQ